LKQRIAKTASTELEALARAIVRAVKFARTLGGVPGLG
jgi:hypothetical protein